MLKACGVAEFAADIYVTGAAELAAVHSPHAHALIKSIDTSTAEKMPGVIGVMTAKDIKGTNRLKYCSCPTGRVLCDAKVRYIGDPVAAVLAETREQAVAAAQAVSVEYEPLPVAMTAEEALAEGASQIDPDRPNLCLAQPQIRGDAEAALAASAAVVEADFSTQTNHQAALEPEACVAYLEEEEDGDLADPRRHRPEHQHPLHMGMLQDAVGYENIRYEEAYSGRPVRHQARYHLGGNGSGGGASLQKARSLYSRPEGIDVAHLQAPRLRHEGQDRGETAEGKLTAMPSIS